MRTFLVTMTTAVVLTLGEPAAQVRVPAASADPKAVSFEAASIKQNKAAGVGSSVGRQPGGRFAAQNATLLELIEFAYQAQRFRVIGGPAWAGAGRWDVVAKLETVPPPVPAGTPDGTLLALRTLLADRFKLVVGHETRQLPIYALVLARSDGALGPQMSPSAIDCMALMAARNGAAGAAAPPPNPGDRRCGLQGRVGSIQSMGAPLTEFTDSLSSRVQRTVIDRTGLTGGWDFVLTYSADASQIAPGVLAPGSQPPPADPNAPSLFTALQEQLGLKLESTRGPVDALVIERVDRPTDN